jgi:salicylate hydroxylase
MTIYPIARGTFVNIAAFTARYDLENTVLDGPWVQDAPKEQFEQAFEDWEPEIQALLDVRFPLRLFRAAIARITR